MIESHLFDGDFSTIEHLFQFRRWYVADRFKEPPVVEPLLDFLAVRLNGQRAAETSIGLTLVLTDLDERYAVEVGSGVLNYTSGRDAVDAQVTITTTRAGLTTLLAGGTAVKAATESGAVQIEGDATKLSELVGLLDDFEFWFDIVTP